MCDYLNNYPFFVFLKLYCMCRLVKPGGVLVYSTCSIDFEENEERVAAFLLRHPVRPVEETYLSVSSLSLKQTTWLDV